MFSTNTVDESYLKLETNNPPINWSVDQPGDHDVMEIQVPLPRVNAPTTVCFFTVTLW